MGRMSTMNSGFRELSQDEIAAVAGAGWEDVNGNGIYDQEDILNNVSEGGGGGGGGGGYFGSLGFSLGFYGGGFTYGGGELYAYQSVGFGPSPVDVTLGYSSDLENYLGGVGASANGIPGAGLSFDSAGNLTGNAWTVGTPGAQISYEVSVTDAWNEFVREFSSGLYEMMDRPYDMPRN